jgi:serine/threonine protein kinase
VVGLFKLLLTFGPLPDALIEHVDVAKAGELLADLWQAVQENDRSGDFAHWSEDVFPNLTDEAKRLILRMTNLDPAKRATMSEIVKDSYWVEDVLNDTQGHLYDTARTFGRVNDTDDVRTEENVARTRSCKKTLVMTSKRSVRSVWSMRKSVAVRVVVLVGDHFAGTSVSFAAADACIIIVTMDSFTRCTSYGLIQNIVSNLRFVDMSFLSVGRSRVRHQRPAYQSRMTKTMREAPT